MLKKREERTCWWRGRWRRSSYK